MPTVFAASMTSVPGAACTARPSIVRFTRSAIEIRIQETGVRSQNAGPPDSCLLTPVSLPSNSHQRAMLLVRARLSVQMIFKFVPELLHDRDRRHGRGIAQGAEGAAEHVLRDVADQVDVVLRAAAFVEARQDLAQPRRALAARDA